MRSWNWWRLPGTIYLPVWCWRRGTIKPVMHHSACGPAAWKHRTKNISQTLQLSCKRTVPIMTLVSWHWYEPIVTKEQLEQVEVVWRESALKLLETTGPRLLSGRLVFRKAAQRQLRRLPPKVINPVRRHHLRGCVEVSGRFCHQRCFCCYSGCI